MSKISEVGGVSSSLDRPPDREIVSFRSCVRASGRGEAKLRVGVNRQEARDPRRATDSGTTLRYHAPVPRSGAAPGRGVP